MLQFIWANANAKQICTGMQKFVRYFRTRPVESHSNSTSYRMDNALVFKQWLNDKTPESLDSGLLGKKMSRDKADKMMRICMHTELIRQKKLMNFKLPLFSAGDLVEVQYELCRSENRIATFSGYCVQVRRKGIQSSFVLKNTIDGIAVQQRFPMYSPRIVSINVINRNEEVLHAELLDTTFKSKAKYLTQPITRDYRYKWQYNVRHKYAAREGNQKPGIRSLEGKMRRRLTTLRKKYMHQRIAARLPPYVWAGPYPLFSHKRTRFVRADTFRRMLVYAQDELERRRNVKRKIHSKAKWVEKSKGPDYSKDPTDIA